MKAKLFEVRDRATFIPVLAVKCLPSCEEERYLLARSGYGRQPEHQGEYILMTNNLSGGSSEIDCDPYRWGVNPRTYHVAHQHIIENFDRLPTGAVIDVEFILGETKQPKRSERETSIDREAWLDHGHLHT